MRFHLFSNLIGKSSSILKNKMIKVLNGIFIGQRACNIFRSKMTFKARPLTNENAQNALKANEHKYVFANAHQATRLFVFKF